MVLKSRCVRWTGNVARFKVTLYVYYLSDVLKGRDFVVCRWLYGLIILTVIYRLCKLLQVRLLKGNNSSCSVQDKQCTCDVIF